MTGHDERWDDGLALDRSGSNQQPHAYQEPGQDFENPWPPQTNALDALRKRSRKRRAIWVLAVFLALSAGGAAVLVNVRPFLTTKLDEESLSTAPKAMKAALFPERPSEPRQAAPRVAANRLLGPTTISITAGDSAVLGLALERPASGTPGLSINVAGLPEGLMLAPASSSNGVWTLVPDGLATARLQAARTFDGTVMLRADLNSAEGTLLDSKVIRLTVLPRAEPQQPRVEAMPQPPAATRPAPSAVAPTPAPEAAEPQAPALSAEESQKLLSRAQDVKKNGDIAAARLLLERAALSGDGAALYALAETYDPLFLKERNVYGVKADARRAADLYRRAARAGYAQALARAQALAGR